ncbi:hypothetical protein SLEP1_g36983 [Rubroshorea leprosula]|uniref:Pentatricopeptide repeat-containing protein n=1 Tax=Rubroshorea leprosula TaxID=152421 RepID=A0AAV5KTX3_9ROSI|nr:hypothetical protein SLEP1_g36983 [Rubroshorea leprosula]
MRSWRIALSASATSSAWTSVAQLAEMGNTKSALFTLLSSFNTLTHGSTEFKKSLRNKVIHEFDKTDDALTLFNEMPRSCPYPSLVEFDQPLTVVVRMKNYEATVSLCKLMELEGYIHNGFSLSILINCFCHLGLVNFGFSTLGKMFELGFDPDVITFNTLINGSCVEGKVCESRRVFDDMVWDGFHPDLITYSTLVNGLCNIGKSGEAVRLMKRMEEGGFLPNIVIYGTVIDRLCKDGLIIEALKLFSEMIDKGIILDVFICSSLIQAMCGSRKWKVAKSSLDELVGRSNLMLSPII